MTYGTSDLIEEGLAGLNGGGHPAPRGSLGRSHEIGEGLDVDAIILGVGDLIIGRHVTTVGCIFLGQQRRGNPHFVEIRVGGK